MPQLITVHEMMDFEYEPSGSCNGLLATITSRNVSGGSVIGHPLNKCGVLRERASQNKKWSGFGEVQERVPRSFFRICENIFVRLPKRTTICLLAVDLVQQGKMVKGH
jgi:hypothetical protein